MAGSIGPDGRVYYTGEDFDPTEYGGARFPGSTPGGPPEPPPPQVPVNTVSLADLPDAGPVPISNASVMTRPVRIGTPQDDQPLAHEMTPMAAPAPRPVDPNSLDAMGLAMAYGKKRVGPTAAREAGYVNDSRAGAFDATGQAQGINSAYEAQRDAVWQSGGAALQQNDAEVEMMRRREEQIEQMQLEQARKNAAVREQVAADRQEYDKLKRVHQEAEAKGGNILDTPGGALSTLFGMLAIGLASKGSRENLNATISAVNGNIDRQVQAQRADNAAKGEAANSAYARYMKSYGNDEQAQAATKALMTERAMAEIERMGAQSRDPQIQAQTAAAIAQLQAERDMALGKLDTEAQGKVMQRYQTARAATRGGLVDLTLDEQMKLGKYNADTAGQNLQNEKTAAETKKLTAEASGVGPDAMKDFSKQLEQRRAHLEVIAKTEKAIDKLKSSKKGENFGGLDDTSATPITASVTGAIERQFNDTAAREMNEIDGIIDAKARAAFGAYNPQQREDIANRVLGDGSKKGLLANLQRDLAESKQAVAEIDGSVPAGVIEASEGRRKQTGASQNTVARPGSAR